MPSANRYTTTEFINSVKRRAHVPSNQTPFDNDGILALANEEQEAGIVSQILSARENYYATYTDLPLNSENIYAIPTRAIGGALSDVQIVNGTAILPVSRSEINDQFSTVTSPTGGYAFMLVGNSVQILPNPVAGVVRLWHYRAPNQLVQTSEAAQITAIAGNVLTFSTIPSTITTSSPCDLIKDQPGFEWLGIDLTPVNVTATTIEFASVPATTAVGDWVALAGQTPVPQIPKEFRTLLVQRTTIKYYEAQGYFDKMKVAQNKLEELEKEVMDLINPRVAEVPKRIVSPFGVIGKSRRWRRQWTAN